MSLTRPLLTALAVLLPTAAPCADAGRTDDMKTVKERLRARCGGTAPRAEEVARLLRTQRPDGSWPDIDYAHAGRARWRPAEHMTRLLTLARASESDGETDQRKATLAAIKKGLGFWCEKDFKCPNWWYNQIGVPRTLYRVLLLVENAIPRELVKRCLPILERAKLGMTGQNLVWVAETTIARGCLIGDAAVVREAFGRIAREIRMSNGEGIQADWSFWQHGNQLYSGGYGRGFSCDCPGFAALAQGTAFAFPPSTIEVLSRYILDGDSAEEPPVSGGARGG